MILSSFLFEVRQSSRIRIAKDSFPRCINTKQTRKQEEGRKHAPSSPVHLQR